MKKLAAAGASLAILTAAAPAMGAPFAIQYETAVSNTGSLPNVSVGDKYTVTLVVDNGGTSAASQTWVLPHLRCAVISFGNNHEIYYAQDLVTTPAGGAGGALVTNSDGQITSHFHSVNGTGTTNYTTNQTHGGQLEWYVSGINPALMITGTYTLSTTNGVTLTPSDWSNPASSISDCSQATATQYLPTPTAVPTLSEWAMILFATLLGGSAAIVAGRSRKLS